MAELAETLRAGRPALTAECLPPRGADAAAIKRLAGAFPPRVDAVVVADDPGEVRGSALACAALLAAEGRDAVLSLSTRDRNRIALESDVLGASALGVRNFLCMSGIHPSLGVSPQAAAAYDIDSIQLARALKSLSEEGLGFDGRPVEAPPKLLIGAVAHPYLRPLELALIRLRKKIKAGASFLLTQAVFDLAGFAEWMDAVRAEGLEKRAAIIASVLPLSSVQEARELEARRTYGPIGEAIIERLRDASDPEAEGIAICAERVESLRRQEGIAGIHILCGGREDAADRWIREAGLA